MCPNELRARFGHFPPVGNQSDRIAAIRSAAHGLASLINEHTDHNREQSLAITNLEQAVHWAIASIGREDRNMPREEPVRFNNEDGA